MVHCVHFDDSGIKAHLLLILLSITRVFLSQRGMFICVVLINNLLY